MHAAGAGGLAGQAREAVVEVGYDVCLEGDALLVEGTHEVDAAAWPFEFVALELIGGAGGVAESAVDAATHDAAQFVLYETSWRLTRLRWVALWRVALWRVALWWVAWWWVVWRWAFGCVDGGCLGGEGVPQETRRLRRPWIGCRLRRRAAWEDPSVRRGKAQRGRGSPQHPRWRVGLSRPRFVRAGWLGPLPVRCSGVG